jgi:hypothetical protein
MAKIQDNSACGYWDSYWIYYDNGNVLVSSGTGLNFGTDANIQMEFAGTLVTFRIDPDRNGTWDYTYTGTVATTAAGLCGAGSYQKCFLDDWCYGINCSYPLPISLVDFSATCVNEGVKLQWTTASETNNKYFTIERKNVALSWEKIAEINGAGNSNDLRKYSYTDPNFTYKTTYYRLKQTDFDGAFEYFDPVVVQCDNTDDMNVAVYPNPFQQEVQIEISNIQYPNTTIAIYDIIGNKILEKQFSNIENQHISTAFDLHILGAGLYFIEVKSSNSFKKNFKIVKI